MTKHYKLPNGYLSFSAMSLFLSCQKRFTFRYVHRVPTEWQNTGAMDRGWAFHKFVEDGVSEETLNETAKRLGNDKYELQRVLVAYGAYKEKIDAGDLPRMNNGEQKLISEEGQYLGFVDRWRIDEQTGHWMFGEMKTSQRFDQYQWMMAEHSFQMALEQWFSGEWAAKNYLVSSDFEGFSHERIIMSSKKPAKATKTKAAETPEDFKWRMQQDTKVYHKMVQLNEASVFDAVSTFNAVKEGVDGLMRGATYPKKNQQSCFSYNRPCEYFRHCWGINPEDATAAHPEATIEFDEVTT